MKLALIQMNPGNDKAKNLALAERLVAACVEKERPNWIALPEMFDFAGDAEQKRASAEKLGEGAAYKFAQSLAHKYGITLHAGSFHEWREDLQRIGNTTVVFNPKGEQIALYRKLHLFDIVTPSGIDYRESAQIAAGSDIVTYQVEGMTFGCAICYDLRFPELFQALRLKSADIIILPSAFTRETGRAHWDILLKARAIETQCYVAAPAQTGAFLQNGKERFTYGHSAIIDPWGKTVAEIEDGNGYVVGEADADLLKRVRLNMPVIQHRRFVAPELKPFTPATPKGRRGAVKAEVS